MTTPPVNSPTPPTPSTPSGPPDLASEMERLFQEQQAASQSAPSPSPHAEGLVGADPAQVASTDPSAIGTDPANPAGTDATAPHLAPEDPQPYDPFATATPAPGQPSTPHASPYDEVRQYLSTVDDAALESLLALQQWAENLSPAQVELINQVLTSGEGEPGGSPGAIASNGQHNPVGPPSAQPAPTLAPSDYDDMDPALAAELRFLREQYARLEQQLQPVQTFTQQQIQQQQQQESAYAIQQFASQYNFTPEEMAYLSQRIQNSATLEAQYRDTGSVGQAVFNSLLISAATNPTLAQRIHQFPGAAGSTPAHVPPAAPDPTITQPPVDPAFARRAAAGQLAATPGSIPRVPPAPQTPHDRQSALADALRATGQFG